ncbi:MAG: hypothetical protein V7K48_25930 [Nostoc sp.]|uniref:hypothetical protein n=1 Tax=Nostoc sp. TaxID=1180 RepID=UPI002FFB3097
MPLAQPLVEKALHYAIWFRNDARSPLASFFGRRLTNAVLSQSTREPPTLGEASANVQRLIKKTATPSLIGVYAALYLSEAMIAGLQLLADTPEKRKLVVLGAMKKLKE